MSENDKRGDASPNHRARLPPPVMAATGVEAPAKIGG